VCVSIHELLKSFPGIDDQAACSELRKIVAREILDKPDEYCEIVLGKPPKEYVDWIRRDQSWGGAIELRILSEYYATEIVIVNAQTATLTRFGEDKNYEQRIFVYYDGIHYDGIYWEPSDVSAMNL
jgi:ubiquitin thioesterase OTU1